MHVPDGIAPFSAVMAGFGLTAGVTWYSIRRIRRESDPVAGIPRASIMTAAFFSASLIHVPVPPVSVHLLLNGLMGIVLGFYAFPAILVGLLFQAVLFGHGGVTSLGINAVIIGIPALAAGAFFRLRVPMGWNTSLSATGIFGGLSAVLAIALSVLLFVIALSVFFPDDLSGEVSLKTMAAISVGHVPLLGIEGAITAMTAMFLHRTRPGMLEGT